MNDFNQNNYGSPENTEEIQTVTENGGVRNNTAAPPENSAGQVNFYDNSEYISPVYVAKKREVNLLAVLLPTAAVFIAAAAVFIILMLNKPVSYREAEKNFLGGLFSAAEQTESVLYGQIGSEKLTVDVSTPLGDLAGIDLSGYGLEIDTANGETAAYALIKAMLGEEINLTAEMWLDRAGGKNYIFLPEISEIYLMQDYSQSTRSAESYADYAESLQEVFEKTSEVYFELVGNPETERNIEFTVNNVTYTADMAVIHLDMSQMAAVCKAFLENMAENPKTADLLCQIGGYDTAEEMREELKEFTDELQEIIDGGGDVDGALDMTVYMKNNTVIGREIVISDYDTDEKLFVDIYQVPAENGENGYFHFKNNSADSYDVSELTFSYKDETKGDRHSGTFSFDINENGDTVNVGASYENLSFAEESFGGVVDITLSSSQQSDYISLGFLTDYSVKIKLAKDGEKKTISVTVPNICTVNLVLEPSDLEFKAVPTPDSSKVAVMSGDFEESEAFNQFFEDFLDYFLPSYEAPDYGVNDYPYFPEVTETEDENENKFVDTSIIAGDWSPVKMEIFGEEYDLDDEIGSYMKGITYSFTGGGVLTVTDEEADLSDVYFCYFDSEDNSRIVLEDDIYSSIYYFGDEDLLWVGNEDGSVVIWLGRK